MRGKWRQKIHGDFWISILALVFNLTYNNTAMDFVCDLTSKNNIAIGWVNKLNDQRPKFHIGFKFVISQFT